MISQHVRLPASHRIISVSPSFIQLKPRRRRGDWLRSGIQGSPGRLYVALRWPRMEHHPSGGEGRSKGPDDLAAVCRINYTAPCIIARPDAPYKTLREMVQWAKANPGQLVFGHSGPWGARICRGR